MYISVFQRCCLATAWFLRILIFSDAFTFSLFHFRLITDFLDYQWIFFLSFYFFIFGASYLLLSSLYSRLLTYSIFRVYLLNLHPSAPFDFLFNSVPGFLFAVLYLSFSGPTAMHLFSKLSSMIYFTFAVRFFFYISIKFHIFLFLFDPFNSSFLHF